AYGGTGRQPIMVIGGRLGQIMGYPARLQVEAFALYCQGQTAEKIAESLKQNHSADRRPQHRTINWWMVKGNWVALKQGIHQHCGRPVDPAPGSHEERLQTELTDLRSRIMDATLGLRFKTAGEAVRSLTAVQKIIDSADSETNGVIPRETLELILDDFFQVLDDDGEMATLLEQRKHHILRRIETKFLKRHRDTSSHEA
ncbi:MAG: hypothetical protein V3W14_12490, partial [Candidatus Neomarinimicrobiota bacterium]